MSDSPRNYALDKLKLLGLLDLTGNTNSFLETLKESPEQISKNSKVPSLNDEETKNRLTDMAMSTPAIGMTRAVKQLGPLVGKAENALASVIKDASPQAEHIRNLQAIREAKVNPQKIGEGFFKKAYEVGDKVVKKFKPEEVLPEDFYKDAVREQLVFDKLKDLNPNTKSYGVGDNIYQVQKKVTPYENITSNTDEWDDRASVLKQASKANDVYMSDMNNPSNHGEIGDKMKIIDAGGGHSLNTLVDDIVNLRNTFKTSKENEPKLIKELFDLKKGK